MGTKNLLTETVALLEELDRSVSIDKTQIIFHSADRAEITEKLKDVRLRLQAKLDAGVRI